MANDGVYSRYLTKYPSAGRYSFTAQVDDNVEKAYTIQVKSYYFTEKANENELSFLYLGRSQWKSNASETAKTRICSGLLW